MSRGAGGVVHGMLPSSGPGVTGMMDSRFLHSTNASLMGSSSWLLIS